MTFDPSWLWLLVAGLAGGYVAGLIGVGGGIIFAPVLLIFFSRAGIVDPVLAPLVVGTSLLCTLLASTASAYFHAARKAVAVRVALVTGSISAVAVYLAARFVTTAHWYDKGSFTVVFSVVLCIAGARMLIARAKLADDAESTPGPRKHAGPGIVGTGLSAGAVSAMVGVGGGLIFVPGYHSFLRFPMNRAVGTSSATICVTSLAGVITYLWLGLGSPSPPGSLGFVDIPAALLLAFPAMLTARLGVITAHHVNRVVLRRIFGVVMLIVAVRLLVGTFAG